MAVPGIVHSLAAAPVRCSIRRLEAAKPDATTRNREDDVKLGFLTAPFPQTPLMQVADWGRSVGFETMEIACWPKSTGPTRRYAGTTHIDAASVSASGAKEIVAELKDKNLSISGLAYYPNP